MSDINVTVGGNTVGVSLTTTAVSASIGAAKGLAGDDGREIEIQNNGTHIQWRYAGDVSWTNLVALSTITGATGATGIVVKGGYDSLTAYVPNDAVTHNGSFYICILATQGNNPSNVTYWTKYVSKGDTGATGADGASGTSDHTLLTNIGTNTHSQIDSHIGSTSNPHSVTKTQVGLGNVDNTSDAEKPISTLTQTALNLKLDASAYNNHFRGKYVSLVALQTAIPTATDGDYALVDAGIEDEADLHLWDAQDGWVLGSSTSPSTTDALTEGSTNLYFTAERVRNALLSGLSTVTNAAIAATDSVLAALGKLQAQVTALGTSKADLALANFTNLQVGSKQVAGYEYGSNTNGRWQKWYDKDGNLIKVEQSNHDRLTRLNGEVVTFPVAFPDTDWFGSVTTHLADRAVAISFSGAITATDFVLVSRVASTSSVAAAPTSWTATWMKT